MGNDVDAVASMLYLDYISIHVPSWGTTNNRRHYSQLLQFQSTFPRGERPFPPIMQPAAEYFNPRSLVGNDGVSSLGGNTMTISIHVPSWGTTVWVCHPQPPELISIHVPSWGTTIDAAVAFGKEAISIHVPSWGTTANFHKYSLFFYAINIIFLLFIIPSLFSLVLFMLLF